MASIGSLTADLRLESAAFMRDMTKATKAVQSNTAQMRRSMQQVEKASRNLNRQFGQLRNAAAALAGALAVRQFTRFTSSAIAAGDALAKQARQVGLAADAYQRLRIEGELAGVTTAKMETAVGAFTKRVGELRAGTGTLVTILDKSNVSLKNQLLAAESTDEAMRIMLDTIRQTSSAFDRQALSAAAFGRQSGQAMVLLADSAGQLDMEMVKLVTRSDEMLAASERLNDQFTLLKAAFSAGFDTAIVEGLAGSVDSSAEAMREAREIGEQFGRAVGVAMRGVAAAAQFVGRNIREITATLAALIALKAAGMFIALGAAVIKFAQAAIVAARAGALLNTVMSKSVLGVVAKLAITLGAAALTWEAFGAEALAAADAIDQAAAAIGADLGGTTAATDAATQKAKGYIQTLKHQRDQAAALAKAHREGADAVEQVTVAIELHNKELSEDIVFTREQRREMAALIKERRAHEKAIQKTIQAQEDAARAAKEAAEEQRRVVERSVDSIVDYAGNTFADLFSDTEFSWKKMWERLRQTAIQTIARMAAEAALRPIITPIVASFMGATVAGGARGAAAGGQSAGSGLGSLLGGNGFSPFGPMDVMNFAFPGGGIGGGINSFGASLGFSPVSSSFIGPLTQSQAAAQAGAFTSATLSGTLGAAGLGFAGGSLLAQLTGGNSLYGGIGGGLGAGIGFMVGGPVGGLIGGAAGGLLGGMFGGGKQSVGPIGHTNIGLRNGQLVVGSTGVDNGAMAAATIQAANQAVQAINSLAQSLNLTIRSAGPGRISQGAASGPQSAESFVSQFIGGGGFGSDDPIIDRVLRSGKVTASTIESDIGLARLISDLENGVTALDKAIREVTEGYTKQIDRAKELGLETAKLADLRDREIAAVKAQARTPFVQAAGGIVDFLRLQSFSSASTLTPTQRLVEAQRQFGDLLGRVKGGEAGLSGTLTQAAGQLLDVGRNNFASSVDFANLERFVRSNLLSVAEQLSSDEFFDAQVEATKQQTEVLSDDLTRLNETVEKMRNEIRLLGDKLAA